MARLTPKIRSMESVQVYLRTDSATKACMKMIKWLVWVSRSIQILSSTWVSIGIAKDTVVASYSYRTVVNTKETGERIVCMVKVTRDCQTDRATWFTQTTETVSIVLQKAKYTMAWALVMRERRQDLIIRWDYRILRIVNPVLTVSMEVGIQRGHMELRVVTTVNPKVLKTCKD